MLQHEAASPPVTPVLPGANGGDGDGVRSAGAYSKVDSAPSPAAAPRTDRFVSLIATKERELREINELRLGSLQQAVEERDAALDDARRKFKQLTADFEYNLRLLEERDAELEQFERTAEQFKGVLRERDVALEEEKLRAADAIAAAEKAAAAASEGEAFYKTKLKESRLRSDASRWEHEEALKVARNAAAAAARDAELLSREHQAELEAARAEATAATEAVLRRREAEHEHKVEGLEAALRAAREEAGKDSRAAEARHADVRRDAEAAVDEAVRARATAEGEVGRLRRALEVAEAAAADATSARTAQVATAAQEAAALKERLAAAEGRVATAEEASRASATACAAAEARAEACVAATAAAESEARQAQARAEAAQVQCTARAAEAQAAQAEAQQARGAAEELRRVQREAAAEQEAEREHARRALRDAQNEADAVHRELEDTRRSAEQAAEQARDNNLAAMEAAQQATRAALAESASAQAAREAAEAALAVQERETEAARDRAAAAERSAAAAEGRVRASEERAAAAEALVTSAQEAAETARLELAAANERAKAAAEASTAAEAPMVMRVDVDAVETLGEQEPLFSDDMGSPSPLDSPRSSTFGASMRSPGVGMALVPNAAEAADNGSCNDAKDVAAADSGPTVEIEDGAQVELQALLSENAALRRAVAQMRDQMADMAAAQAAPEALHCDQNLVSVDGTADQAKAGPLLQVQERQAQLEAQLAQQQHEFEAQLQTMRSQWEAMHGATAAAEKQNHEHDHKYEEEVFLLRGQLRRVRRERDDARRECELVLEQSNQAQHELQQREAEVADLREQLENFQHERRTPRRESYEAKLDEIEDRMMQLAGTNRALRKQLEAARAAAGSQRKANRATENVVATHGDSDIGVNVHDNDMHGQHSFAFEQDNSSGEEQGSDEDVSGTQERQPQKRSAVMTARARLAEARRKLDHSFEEGEGVGDGNNDQQACEQPAQLAIAGRGVAVTPPQAPAPSVRANASSRTTESQRKAVARMTVQRRRRAEQAQERKLSVRNYNKKD